MILIGYTVCIRCRKIALSVNLLRSSEKPNSKKLIGNHGYLWIIDDVKVQTGRTGLCVEPYTLPLLLASRAINYVFSHRSASV